MVFDLAEVFRQMLCGHMNVRALDGPLHDGPKALNRVRMVPLTHVFLGCIVERDVVIEILEAAIGTEPVRLTTLPAATFL